MSVKSILNILKWVVIAVLGGVALIFLGDLLGLINVALISLSITEILAINIPITILTAYPNVWLIFGYFAFKGVITLSINILKRVKN